MISGMKPKQEALKIPGRTHCLKCGYRKNAILPTTGWCRKCTLERNLAKAKLICPKHPHVRLRCLACIGTEGGQSTSAAKVEAARANGRLGGRPPKNRA